MSRYKLTDNEKKYCDYIDRHRIRFGNYFYPYEQRDVEKDDKFKIYHIKKITKKYMDIRFKNNNGVFRDIRTTKEAVYDYIESQLKSKTKSRN